MSPFKDILRSFFFFRNLSAKSRSTPDSEERMKEVESSPEIIDEGSAPPPDGDHNPPGGWNQEILATSSPRHIQKEMIH